MRPLGNISTRRSGTSAALQEITYDGTSYLCASWEQMGWYNFNLGKQINAYTAKTGRNFNRIVALANGGLTWARDLADNTNIHIISTVRIKSYTGINASEEPILDQYHKLHHRIDGERVLIFDDVADSGQTLKRAIHHVKEQGADDVHTATLAYKPRSMITPDFFAFKTNDSWIIFPHEIREFVHASLLAWGKNGIPHKTIQDRLIQLGIPREQVTYYMAL